MKYILYSPGYGAGWSTWADTAEQRKLMVNFQPIVDALLQDESIVLTEEHPAVQALLSECDRIGLDHPYLGGLRNLRCYTGPDDVLVRIHEYDGSERIVTADAEEWY